MHQVRPPLSVAVDVLIAAAAGALLGGTQPAGGSVGALLPGVGQPGGSVGGAIGITAEDPFARPILEVGRSQEQ